MDKECSISYKNNEQNISMWSSQCALLIITRLAVQQLVKLGIGHCYTKNRSYTLFIINHSNVYLQYSLDKWLLKTQCALSYNQTGCAATSKLGHTTWTLFLFKSQRVLKDFDRCYWNLLSTLCVSWAIFYHFTCSFCICISFLIPSRTVRTSVVGTLLERTI